MPSQEAGPVLVVKPENLPGPNATSAAYVVNTYSAPMSKVASRTASWIVRRGLRASSASGAAPSNPPNASTLNPEPAMTPDRPWNADGVYLVVNTDTVLWLPAWNSRKMPISKKTAISKTPRMVPNLAEVLTP